eukprot:5597078-Alexandrium_andersonii.AAC.1
MVVSHSRQLSTCFSATARGRSTCSCGEGERDGQHTAQHHCWYKGHWEGWPEGWWRDWRKGRHRGIRNGARAGEMVGVSHEHVSTSWCVRWANSLSSLPQSQNCKHVNLPFECARICSRLSHEPA